MVRWPIFVQTKKAGAPMLTILSAMVISVMLEPAKASFPILVTIAVGRIGNNNRAAGTAVARDGDRAIVGRERELRLRHGGQQHRSQQAELKQVSFGCHFLIAFNGFSLQVPVNVISSGRPFAAARSAGSWTVGASAARPRFSHTRKASASSRVLVRAKAPSPLPLCRRTPRRFAPLALPPPIRRRLGARRAGRRWCCGGAWWTTKRRRRLSWRDWLL